MSSRRRPASRDVEVLRSVRKDDLTSRRPSTHRRPLPPGGRPDGRSVRVIRRGEDTLLERAVAVKLLLDYGDPRSVARFHQEAQILARLHHPNVINVFDTGVDGGDRFIVMELVEDPTLGSCSTRTARSRPNEQARSRAAWPPPSGSPTEKPSSTVTSNRRTCCSRPMAGVKLADMGIARLLSPEALTATLSVRGTALYISPEQVRGDPVDARADLYSLGCVLFEMLTGRTPFEGDLAALSYAHTHTLAPRARSIDPSVPAAMDELVAAMLEKDPARRPPTGEEVERSLAATMRHDAVVPTALMEPVQGPPSPTARPPAVGVGDPDGRLGRWSSSRCAASPCSCSSRCWQAVSRTANPMRLNGRRSPAARPRRNSLRLWRPARRHRRRDQLTGSRSRCGRARYRW